MQDTPNPYNASLIALARQLVAQLPDKDLRAAFLFGSAAWGDADASSDLDIMLLVDRLADYRQVIRIRLADLFGSPLPDGPLFADLDRIATEAFIAHIQAGEWAGRVVNSVILADTDDFYARLRTQVSEAFLRPSARVARFHAREERAEEERAAALRTLDTDPELSALHARLALQHAGSALIELSGNRVSPSHFVESLERALEYHGSLLFPQCLAALALDVPDEAVNRSLQAYDTFADVLRRWVHEPNMHSRLSQEDLAWARHTYGKQEEITHKVAAFTRAKRIPPLLHYLDELFQVPICIQFSKLFQLRTGGNAERMSVPDFHVAMRQEPALYDEWVAALRLSAERDRLIDGIELAQQLLAVGRAAIATSRLDL